MNDGRSGLRSATHVLPNHESYSEDSFCYLGHALNEANHFVFAGFGRFATVAFVPNITKMLNETPSGQFDCLSLFQYPDRRIEKGVRKCSVGAQAEIWEGQRHASAGAHGTCTSPPQEHGVSDEPRANRAARGAAFPRLRHGLHPGIVRTSTHWRCYWAPLRTTSMRGHGISGAVSNSSSRRARRANSELLALGEEGLRDSGSPPPQNLKISVRSRQSPLVRQFVVMTNMKRTLI